MKAILGFQKSDKRYAHTNTLVQNASRMFHLTFQESAIQMRAPLQLTNEERRRRNLYIVYTTLSLGMSVILGYHAQAGRKIVSDLSRGKNPDYTGKRKH